MPAGRSVRHRRRVIELDPNAVCDVCRGVVRLMNAVDDGMVSFPTTTTNRPKWQCQCAELADQNTDQRVLDRQRQKQRADRRRGVARRRDWARVYDKCARERSELQRERGVAMAMAIGKAVVGGGAVMVMVGVVSVCVCCLIPLFQSFSV